MFCSVPVCRVTDAKRNYGIDLLRIVAMLMVCMIHVNLFTKAHMELVPGKEYFYYFGIWTETVGMIGVNLYAMITGYVCVMGNWRYSRYVRLWVLVCFYTLLIYLIGYVSNLSGVLFWPGGILHIAKQMCMLCFGSSYWYFAAYTGLFFIIPFLNAGLRNLSKSRFTCLVLSLVLLLPVINFRAGGTIYGAGYNMIWLAVLYVVGAYVKLHPPVFLPSFWLLPFAFISTLQPLAFALVGLPPMNGYTWPVAIVYSVALFIIFSRFSVSSVRIQRFISWAAPASFAVYLIHVHPWTWTMLCKYVPQLNIMLDYPWWIALVGGLAIYMAGTLFDRFRMLLFNICRVDSMCDYVAGWIENRVSRMLNWIVKF